MYTHNNTSGINASSDDSFSSSLLTMLAASTSSAPSASPLEQQLAAALLLQNNSTLPSYPAAAAIGSIPMLQSFQLQSMASSYLLPQASPIMFGNGCGALLMNSTMNMSVPGYASSNNTGIHMNQVNLTQQLLQRNQPPYPPASQVSPSPRRKNKRKSPSTSTSAPSGTTTPTRPASRKKSSPSSVDANRKAKFAAALKKSAAAFRREDDTFTEYELPTDETLINLLDKFYEPNGLSVEEAAELYAACITVARSRTPSPKQEECMSIIIRYAKKRNPNLDLEDGDIVVAFRLVRNPREGEKYPERNPMANGMKPKISNGTMSVRAHCGNAEKSGCVSTSLFAPWGGVQFSERDMSKYGTESKDLRIEVMVFDLKERNGSGLVNVDVSGRNKLSEQLRRDNQLHYMRTKGTWQLLTREMVVRGAVSKFNVVCQLQYSGIEGAWKNGNGDLLCLWDGECTNVAVDCFCCREHYAEKFEGVYSQSKFRRCSMAGCNKWTVGVWGANEFCPKHGGEGCPKCSHGGCDNLAVWCIETKCLEVCIRHGAQVALCSHEGCSNFAQIGGVCIRHGAKVKRCSHEGCTNNVKKGGVCVRHGAKQIRKTCSREGAATKSSKEESVGGMERRSRDVLMKDAPTITTSSSMLQIMTALRPLATIFWTVK